MAKVPLKDLPRRHRPRRNGNDHESLAEHIARSSPAERLEAGRVVGPALVWDEMICPVLSDDRAAEDNKVA
jgi:hypothetical protein